MRSSKSRHYLVSSIQCKAGFSAKQEYVAMDSLGINQNKPWNVKRAQLCHDARCGTPATLSTTASAMKLKRVVQKSRTESMSAPGALPVAVTALEGFADAGARGPDVREHLLLADVAHRATRRE